MVDSCKRPFPCPIKNHFPFSETIILCVIKAFECTLNVLKDNNTIHRVYGINNPLKCPSVRLRKYDDVTMSTCGKENPQGFYVLLSFLFFGFSKENLDSSG